MIIGFRLEDYRGCGIKVPVSITRPKKTSNILIAGKSGSGKSLTARWYLWQILHTEGGCVYIADYKAGEEYEAFEGSPSYASGNAALDMVDWFYDLYMNVRGKRIRLKRNYTLFVEEWFGLVNYAETQSKKRKAELLAKMGELLAVSRGLNLSIILAVQRADASLFNSGSREQFQCVLSFGRCSKEQWSMLGFSSELEENPTLHYKAGQGIALIDGQEGACEFLVPLVKNPDVMCQGIRYHLDRQPSLTSLTSAVAEGRSTGL